MMTKRKILQFFGLLAFGIITTSFNCRSNDKKPNIILILADDLGYSDLSMNGSDLYETPHIDRLASQSVIFTKAYASHPTCLPSRLAIQTGKYPARLNCVNHDYGMEWKENTIAERLKRAGYNTCHIGKWHLGKSGYRPTSQGYDTTIATNFAGQPASYFYPFKNPKKSIFDVPDLEDSNSDDFLTEKLADKAIDYIRQNSENPFFMNLCFYAVHTPIQAEQDKIDKYKGKVSDEMRHNNPVYAGLVEHLDDAVGKIMETLKRSGIADNTIVLFFSDNGGVARITSNFPLRGGKSMLYEGGIRVPLFIKWPGVTKEGLICDEPVAGHDFFPTILSMAGIKKSNNKSNSIDGVDISPLLKNPEKKLNRDELHWLYFPVLSHYFGNLGNPSTNPGGAIIKDGWKLIEFMETPQGLKHHYELYNLNSDPGEQKDVSADYPEIVKSLKKSMTKWRTEVNAPTYNMSMYNK